MKTELRGGWAKTSAARLVRRSPRVPHTRPVRAKRGAGRKTSAAAQTDVPSAFPSFFQSGKLRKSLPRVFSGGGRMTARAGGRGHPGRNFRRASPPPPAGSPFWPATAGVDKAIVPERGAEGGNFAAAPGRPRWGTCYASCAGEPRSPPAVPSLSLPGLRVDRQTVAGFRYHSPSRHEGRFLVRNGCEAGGPHPPA